MKDTSIPTYYFPSTALFLDDNHDFLLNFVLQLDEGVAYRIFDAPRKALDYIHHKTCSLELLNQRSNEDQSTTFPQSMVYNPHRFSEISVVIVDYVMPGMDGLEFCRNIENPHIKKILLTGQADEKLAIEAFNEGLIHRYVKKSDINAAHLITKSIHELQLEYFQGMSDKLLRDKGLLLPACSQDKAFISLFQRLCEENRVLEYYMMDSSGSFFMLDEDANISMLIIKREDDFRLHAEWALANGENKDVIESLSQGKTIPVTPLEKGIPTIWVPAHRLVGDHIYSYAYVPGEVLLDKKHQKILSYQRYLEEIDAEELLS